MSKKKNQVSGESFKKGKTNNVFVRLDQMEGQVKRVLNEVINVKYSLNNRAFNLERSTTELKNESIKIGMYMGALIDMFSELFDIPRELLVKRFMELINQRRVVDDEGMVRGELIITRYNFS